MGERAIASHKQRPEPQKDGSLQESVVHQWSIGMMVESNQEPHEIISADRNHWFINESFLTQT